MERGELMTKIAIKTKSGFYFSAINGGGGELRAVGGAPNSWETFEQVETDDNKIAFKTFDGQHYLSIDNGSVMNAAVGTIGECEKFEFIEYEHNKVGLK